MGLGVKTGCEGHVMQCVYGKFRKTRIEGGVDETEGQNRWLFLYQISKYN
jgi:hypothetical protein